MRRRIFLALLLACVTPCAIAANSLRLATWNLEWLLNPETARDLRVRCQRGERQRLPCDVVQGARSEADWLALRRHAARLDADVIALQEVEDAVAAERVFRGYAFCFTARRDRQNVGFAIRRGIPFRCEPDLVPLSVRDRVRRGAVITLYPDDVREMRLLSVHLKSGCSRDPLDAPAASCRTLARQAPILANWIDAEVAAGRAYGILGDFNRDLRGDASMSNGLWATLSDGRPKPERLRDAASGTRFVACHPGQSFTRYIDYVLLGGPLADRQVANSVVRHVFDPAEARRRHLSDHCPLSVRVNLR
ncbi:MAG: endonuclease/exonuclease/phosphatase family protein [Steroidobacteraceae bacterium]